MSAVAVQVQNLTKSYPQRSGWRKLQRAGGTQAVRGVDLSVNEGELFGLLGPNGAGKTTLVKMLCTLIVPTSGSATVAGFDLAQDRAIRGAVGLVVTDERSFYWRLSARRNLKFFAAMHGLHGVEAERRVDEVLDSVQLLDVADQNFNGFSSGMKQRLAIARGLIHRPKIIFLDEPSRSLDPTSTNNLHDLILSIQAQRQMTVFLITHDLNEAEKLCDRVAIMNKGKVRGVGSSAELRQQLSPTVQYKLTVSRTPELALENVVVSGNEVVLNSAENTPDLNNLIDTIRQQEITIHSIESRPASLEEVFNQLTAE